jgi:Ca2+-binding RTX toxin-like protein
MDEGFFVSLPNDQISQLIDTRVGLALSLSDLEATTDPQSLIWLLGDYENIIGSSHGDFLTGNDLSNTIIGGSGNDYIFGLGGDDVFIEDLGSDTIDGGEGNDLYVLTQSLESYRLIFDALDGSFLISRKNDLENVDTLRSIEHFSFNGVKFSGSQLVDVEAPRLLSTVPSHDSRDVYVDSNITLTFDEFRKKCG